MDPEERDELLSEIDDELDDSPKGRAMKDTIRAVYARTRRDDEGEDEQEDDGGR